MYDGRDLMVLQQLSGLPFPPYATTRSVTLDNGLAKLTISRPDGSLTGISYGGMDNLLDVQSKSSSRGLRATEYSVVNSSKDCIELSFRSNLPISIDKRIIMRSGVSGFYCYATIYERSTASPAFDLVQTRMVFILRRDKFHYMAITDEKQRIMPMPEDRLPNRCQELIVPEAVLLTNPINPDLKGEVDDKYQYSMDNKDGGLHGWISSGSPTIGFWVVIPTNEYRNGGPTKQNLTCHTGPTCLTLHADFAPGFVSGALIPAKSAYVGLSVARTEGGWEVESKGYQFWVQTDSTGAFSINNVIPGIYGLHGWVPGFVGNYLDKKLVNISAGSETELGNVIYLPTRDGPTVWEIGFPDRTATGFYVPDVNPMYINKLFINSPEK
ncbi:hypothetical protein IFM89_024011 [Coptis chinensis]|uniref:Rhamnogalacturonan lyase domain-containing protein n=1 Tax=Coptis chinensis TaxID=261450 RepID=A0A835HAP6_9MAGN|nr:hypothetical protein IFM89_024011 [Coptis chinensis]